MTLAYPSVVFIACSQNLVRLWLAYLHHYIVNTEKDAIFRVLQPLVAKGSLFTTANKIIQTGIATIIALEYSAFLPNCDQLEHVESAVDYYLKSPTSVAVENVAKEISRQGYKKEELGKKILEFILENRMSKDLAEQK
ncbi:hypothetical protein EDB19DRAFT_2041050 [Suillus lakei]|nr:hypothetical protein EDB19DRAFT_2041050 [Suillus lakei]